MKLDQVEAITKSAGAKVIVKARADVLANYFRLISAVSDEALIIADHRGLFCATVDPAHIQGIEVLLEKERIEISGQSESYQFAVDADILANYLKDFEAEDMLLCLEEKEHKSTISFFTENTTFTWDCLDTAGFKQPELKLWNNSHLVARTCVEASRLTKALKLGAFISNPALVMHENDSDLHVEFSGDKGSLRASIPAKIVSLQDTKMAEARSLFPLEYLENLLRPIPRGIPISIELGIDYPVIIIWRQFDTSVRTAISPRIDSHGD